MRAHYNTYLYMNLLHYQEKWVNCDCLKFDPLKWAISFWPHHKMRYIFHILFYANMHLPLMHVCTCMSISIPNTSGLGTLISSRCFPNFHLLLLISIKNGDSQRWATQWCSIWEPTASHKPHKLQGLPPPDKNRMSILCCT